MTRWARVAAGLVLLAVAAALLAACGPQETATPAGAATQQPGMTPLPGEVLLRERCARCHDLGRVQSARKTLEEWQSTVRRMVSKGTVLDDAEFAVLTQYLADTYK